METDNYKKYKYKIVEDATDFNESKLLKTGLEAEFTMGDIVKEEERLKQKGKNIDAELGFYKTLVTNYEAANPDMAKLITKENIRPFFEYIQAKLEMEQRLDIMEKIQGALDEFKAEKREIYQQLGFVESDNGKNTK